MPLNARLTMSEWLARPWPKNLGDTLVCNSWGYFAIIDGVKHGPYKNLAQVEKCQPKWFWLKYGRKA